MRWRSPVSSSTRSTFIFGSRLSSCVPKPARCDSPVSRRPVSTQSDVNTSPSTSQVTDRVHPGTEKQPCRTALVTISCVIRAVYFVARTDSISSGPLNLTLGSSSDTTSAGSASTITRNGRPCH